MKKSDAKGKKQKNTYDDPATGLLLLAFDNKSFQQKVKNFREKHKIKIPFIRKSNHHGLKTFQSAHDDFDNFMRESKLPHSNTIRRRVWEYVMFGEIGTIGTKRYQIVIHPKIQIDREMNALSHAESVSLVTYAKLSSMEEKQALKELKKMQKWVLHPFVLHNPAALKHTRIDIELGKEMESRIMQKVKKQYTSWYMNEMQKKFDAGRLSKWKFNEIKSNNNAKIEKIKVGYTSKDIAKKVLGKSKKDSLVRQRIRRLKETHEKFLPQ